MLNYKIGTNTLYCGNCFDVFPQIPDKSVNLILCNPPYFRKSIERIEQFIG